MLWTTQLLWAQFSFRHSMFARLMQTSLALMPHRFARCLIAAALVAAVCGAAVNRAEAAAGPREPEGGALRRELWLIPFPAANVEMRTLVFRPRGAGPFPLAVINHGSTQDAESRATAPMEEFEALTAWFVRRGYAVAIPERPGHGRTGGPYFEDQGDCEDADYQRSGLATATSIEVAIAYMTTQPFVRRNDVVVVGQSAGGLGALALASRNPPGVRAVINFSGGRGGRSYNQSNNNCAPERLIQAVRTFGSTARVPTLWIYTENDSYFPPDLSRRMAEEFGLAGGSVEYHLLPPFGTEGHLLAESRDSAPIWGPTLDAFLSRLRASTQ
jgi:dienelactone hydrolase